MDQCFERSVDPSLPLLIAKRLKPLFRYATESLALIIGYVDYRVRKVLSHNTIHDHEYHSVTQVVEAFIFGVRVEIKMLPNVSYASTYSHSDHAGFTDDLTESSRQEDLTLNVPALSHVKFAL